MRHHYVAWVCVDCYFVHHGIYESESGTTPTCALALISASDEITSGLVLDEHEPDCPMRADQFSECECEEIPFSSSPCEGCGSHLAGSRHALTIWPMLVA